VDLAELSLSKLHLSAVCFKLNLYQGVLALRLRSPPDNKVTWHDGTALFIRRFGHPINNVEARRLNTYFLFPLAVPDCAVCEQGFAPGIAYSCRECSGDTTGLAVGLAVAVALALLLVAGLLFSYMCSTVHDETDEGMEIGRRSWKKKCLSFRSTLVNMLPLRAIKIVVTVWQIISQVNERCCPHTISTEGRVRIHRFAVCLAFSLGSTRGIILVSKSDTWAFQFGS